MCSWDAQVPGKLWAPKDKVEFVRGSQTSQEMNYVLQATTMIIQDMKVIHIFLIFRPGIKQTHNVPEMLHACFL